jgi:hypothetical protein
MTTDKDKIDAKLRAEMDRLEAARQAEQAIAVVIEPAANKADRAAVDRAREEIRKRLEQMGAKDVRELALTSALVALLTPRQIRTIAADRAVQRIFWDAPEKVTLG